MPDSFDYEWLRQLLASPQRWTADELAAVRLMIANQRQAFESMHPLDRKGRRAAQAVIDELEAALRAHLGRR